MALCCKSLGYSDTLQALTVTASCHRTDPIMELPHGVFVYRNAERAFAIPDATIYYPDGSIAYKIIVK